MTAYQQKQKKLFYEQHMRAHGKHPNRYTLQAMIDRLYYGVALTEEHLCEAHTEIFEYMKLDPSRLDPCLQDLKFSIRSRDGKILDSWFHIQRDGEEDWRLPEQAVQNLWRLVEV